MAFFVSIAGCHRCGHHLRVVWTSFKYTHSVNVQLSPNTHELVLSKRLYQRVAPVHQEASHFVSVNAPSRGMVAHLTPKEQDDLRKWIGHEKITGAQAMQRLAKQGGARARAGGWEEGSCAGRTMG